MRPFLIKSYHDLKLLQLKEKEAITYNTVQMQDTETLIRDVRGSRLQRM